MTKIEVNAMGLACPAPVIKTKNALAQMKEGDSLEVRVDNEIAVQNVTRFANSKGLTAQGEKLGDKEFLIRIEVDAPVAEAAQEEDAISCTPDQRSNTVVAVSSDCMGMGSEELGRGLMKAFLYALNQQEKLPKTIVFYNGGAKLTVEGSDSLEDLKNMEAQGVEILTCGTCLNHFGLTEKLAVGSVTNMYTIVETLEQAGKVVKP